MKALSHFLAVLLLSAPSAFAAVSVSSPAAGTVVTPITIRAASISCSSQPVAAMGYSFDTSSDTVVIDGQSVDTTVSAPLGAHTLHVKSWGSEGASCVQNVPIDVVVDPPQPPGPSVPSSATTVSSIQTLTNWQAQFDTATGAGTASASGVMALVSAPSLSGSARRFNTSYVNYGGERYSVEFGSDETSTNFVYDAEVYVSSPSTDIANVEMDLNQVLANGNVIIYGFQCDGWSGTWDYTENAGTPQAPIDKWVHTTQACNPQAWSANAWHHIQIEFSRDDEGNVTYKTVWLDGAAQAINATVPSEFALAWGSVLLTNFQIDGKTASAGSATVYLDKLAISRW